MYDLICTWITRTKTFQMSGRFFSLNGMANHILFKLAGVLYLASFAVYE